jgi:hypothetical protein
LYRTKIEQSPVFLHVDFRSDFQCCLLLTSILLFCLFQHLRPFDSYSSLHALSSGNRDLQKQCACVHIICEGSASWCGTPPIFNPLFIWCAQAAEQQFQSCPRQKHALTAAQSLFSRYHVFPRLLEPSSGPTNGRANPSPFSWWDKGGGLLACLFLDEQN